MIVDGEFDCNYLCIFISSMMHKDVMRFRVRMDDASLVLTYNSKVQLA